MLLGAVVLDANKTVAEWLARLAIAVACGFLIGFERKRRSKDAGIRTHIIVCFASALMMIISKYAFSDLVGGALGAKEADPARVAAQVVSGIGFLGAGIIFYRRDLLHGLTTAAGVWATAGIGLAIGAGLVVIGCISTVILFSLQLLLHTRLRILRSNAANIFRIVAEVDDPDVLDIIDKIFKTKKTINFKTKQVEGKIIAEIEIATEMDYSGKELYAFTKQYAFIKSVEKTEEL